MKIDHICLLGGTGFVGAHLARRLAARGKRVTILSRHPQRHAALALHPLIRVVRPRNLECEGLAEAFRGHQAVINLVGILNEPGHDGSGFRQAHVELPRRVVRACLEARVRRLLHMSALNADDANGASYYLKSKGEGENVAHGVAPNEVAVTSFRPSVIFGPGDSFLNRFATLLEFAPGLFPLACPEASFAPVYVGDVVEAFVRSLEEPATFGKRFELCGPRRYTLRRLVAYTGELLGLRRRLIGLPDGLSRLQANLLEFVPGKPFSVDNYRSLQVPSVCRRDGLAELGIEATPLEAVAPGYLGGLADRNRINQAFRGKARRG